jgi:two-component system cell cycle response regulator
MSLRVLLADESASIRKVFQMGLQDFGAEVKSVHNGLDVIEVATNFQPHIVFVDILLQKKNGYEVSQEMRDHAQLKSIPVVLMWSSFMELDQKKYQECGAGAELEKPFDVETMRQLIEQLAPIEDKARISEFLEFPSSISQDFVEEEKAKSDQFRVTTDVKETSEGYESQDPTPPALEVEMAPTENEPEEEHEEHSVFNTHAGGV